MASRAEHLAWCKQRALEYVDMGDANAAISSMLSDLGKWEGGEMYDPIILSFMTTEAMHYRAHPHKIREWVEGFN